ncbi:hypothetical protein KP509_27G013200 [Ceratopteris richardii]|uniref:Uncharacterized protein n=1 Tax=Ceratopteris richardii TaxID=49495 RepID=A0A8T2RFE9_CERRI|nr:hypothetical protein KP509_27G013200 [Ceratopteris richardii]
MATNERRTGVSRRGMTILGKVPVAPKPINLPSQRSTFCWGNAGRIFPTRVHSGKDESAPLKLESNGEKIESKASGSSGTTDCGDGVNLQKKKAEPLPASIKENSAAASTAAMTSSNNAVKVEEPSTCHACDSASLKQESTNPKAQRSGGGFSGGVAAPPGFSHTSSHSNGRTGLVSMDSHCGCPGNGTHAYPLQQSGSHCTPGVPYRTGPKDREIIVIHMVGGPGFYSNYTQFGLPEAYNRNGGSYGSVPLQFGSFEPVFNVPGHGRTDYGPRFASDRGTGYLNEREGYICYEKECYLGGCHGRHRNSQVHRTAGNSFVGNAYGGAYDPMMRVRTGSISHNVLTTKPTRSRSLYCNGISIPSYMEESSAEPVSERPVTLLTKSLQHDPKAQSFSAGDGKNVFYPDSTYLNMELYGDEGKPPLEEFEGARIVEHVQMKATSSSVDSTTSEKKDEAIVLKETSLNKSQVLLSKGICNEKCLHCKDNSTSKISPSLCEACDREHVQMKATSSSVDSTTWEKKDEQIVLKETSLNKSQVSLSKVTCNEKCLHCKDNSTSTISPSLCEVCDREHVQMKASSSSVDSTTWEKKDEAIVLKETSLNKSQVSLSKGTCNEKCLHCKDNSTGRISPSVCEECDREHVQMKATLSPVDSTTREKKDGTIVIKEISSDKSQVSLSKVTCNEKCLHCKDISTSRISPSLCEASDRDNGYETSTTQSNQCFGHTEKDPMTSFGKDAMDGCKTEEKHIIFDADNTKTDTMKSEAFGKEAEVPQRSQILVSDSGDVHATKTNIKIQSDASLKKNAGRNQKFYLKKKLQYKSMVKPGNQVSKAHGVPQKQSSQNLAASFSVKKDPKARH